MGMVCQHPYSRLAKIPRRTVKVKVSPALCTSSSRSSTRAANPAWFLLEADTPCTREMQARLVCFMSAHEHRLAIIIARFERKQDTASRAFCQIFNILVGGIIVAAFPCHIIFIINQVRQPYTHPVSRLSFTNK
jgi:hypothetical protein